MASAVIPMLVMANSWSNDKKSEQIISMSKIGCRLINKSLKCVTFLTAFYENKFKFDNILVGYFFYVFKRKLKMCTLEDKSVRTLVR